MTEFYSDLFRLGNIGGAEVKSTNITENGDSGLKSVGNATEFLKQHILPIFGKMGKALHNREAGFELFDHSLIFVKLFATVIFVILAIVNYRKHKDVGLISSKPGLFFAESVIFGLSTFIPFMVIMYLRGFSQDKKGTGKIFKKKHLIIAGILFLLFFVANYVLELSGFWSVAFEKKTEEPASPAVAVLKPETMLSASDKFGESFATTTQILIGVAFAIPILIMLATAFVVHDVNPNYKVLADKNIGRSIFKMFGKASKGLNVGVFVIEMMVFALASALPVFFMASNRDALDPHETTKEFGLITLKFAVLHILLQLSGFYNHTFVKCHNFTDTFVNGYNTNPAAVCPK